MKQSARSAAVLKRKLKERSEAYSESSRVRIHRAISWLARAERENDDPDAQFVFLWIAFNGAYAKAFGHEETSRLQLNAFFSRLVSIDSERSLAQLLFEHFNGPIRTLIANQFVFEPFWRALRDHDASELWENQFRASSKAAVRAVLDGRAEVVLGVVFDRLYVLRNQLVHGGSTWNSAANRRQVKDGAHIMAAVIPVILGLMLDNPQEEFGEIMYPVV